ncbi:hypothetical protein [Streptomyces justiciae]|uniref:hypothetical protein n=1 Tax=Streptomyces justiciae TaxID=2780140 RepID=UPI00211960B1|nr:hypothetical protein [Streptomyces justiciae]MCW8383972.1 hypothetical protein [Streptomyces justiciae]
MDEVPRAERCPYYKCTACGLISEPDSADYRLTLDRQNVDWAVPMTVRCGSCRAASRIGPADILKRDTDYTCARCDHRTACPGDADRVICWGCGLNSPGPASLGARATYLHDVEHDADQWATAQVRIAKDDARRRGGLPGWAS